MDAMVVAKNAMKNEAMEFRIKAAKRAGVAKIAFLLALAIAARDRYAKKAAKRDRPGYIKHLSNA